MKKWQWILVGSILALLVISTRVLIGCTQASAPETPSTPSTPSTSFSLTSEAFSNNGTIPTAYCSADVTGGQNTSIPLRWSNKPAATKSFALAMVDTSASNFIHWIVINIPSTESTIASNASRTSSMPSGSIEKINDNNFAGYVGPWPPAGEAAHNYVTTIYALNDDSIADDLMAAQITYAQFTTVINQKKIDSASLTGKFSR